jgi:hypothetical protein
MTAELIFESERKFFIHSYQAGHGLLLLRSVEKTNKVWNRVDFLFRDVRAVEIRSWFTGAKIEEVNYDFLNNYPAKPCDMIEVGNKIYAIIGDGWRGYVVGGVTSSIVDEGSPADPSALLPHSSLN